MAAPVTTRVEPSKVKFPSACNSFPVTPVTILLFPLLAIVKLTGASAHIRALPLDFNHLSLL